MHINCAPQSLKALKIYVSKFEEVFSKRLRKTFIAYLSCLMLEYKRCSLQTMSQKTTLATYERLQYFISDSRSWNSEQLNTYRIQDLQKSRSTKTCPKGSLIIDDTACKKSKKCNKTEAVDFQYSSIEDNTVNCNVVVFSTYADNRKHYPLDLRPYKPASNFLFGKHDREFKDKITLAIELFETAVEMGLTFTDVLFDSWYFNERLVRSIEKRGYNWITKAKSNNIVCLHGSWYTVDELVKLIPACKYKKIEYINSRGDKEIYYTYSFVGKVKHIGGPYKIVISKLGWESTDMDKISVFVSNHTGLSTQEILRRYKGRWEIECVFRELKDNFYFDHYQVRSLTGITRHWHLCFLAYTFLIRYELTGSYKKTINCRLHTVGKTLYFYRSLQSLVSYIWISKNKEAYYKLLQANSL